VNNIQSLTKLDIEREIEKARGSELRRSRILLHESRLAPAQKMIIVLFHDSKVGLHRHPATKSETYVCLLGELEVEYEGSDGDTFRSRLTPLESSSSKELQVVSHSGGAWHEPRSISEYCVYLEVYDGPFNKDNDVEYRNSI
jgi:glucose-6-phosphate isomerase